MADSKYSEEIKFYKPKLRFIIPIYNFHYPKKLFNEFKKTRGVVAQTILAKIDVIIHNQLQNDVNLFVRRSFSQHLFSWMNDSASRL